MRMMRAVLVVMVLWAPAAWGLQAESSPEAGLEQFAWLEGHWRGVLPGGERVEQYWSGVEDGSMMGMFRLHQEERLLLLEFFVFQQGEQGLELRVRHFDSALVPMEKMDPIVLLFRGLEGNQARFENPVHNSPKWTYLTRTGEDSFTGRSVIIRDDGSESFIEVHWQRVP